MPNPSRIHVPGGTYYLFRRTDSRYPIFSRPEDYARFEDLLTLALDSSRIKLLGYCWLPDAIHLVIEISDRPIAGFMRNLMWRYSREQQRRPDQTRPWFRERYHATLVQPEAYLDALICYLHYLPMRAGLAASPGDYPYSSHHAYLGNGTAHFVYTRPLFRALGCSGDDREPYYAATAQTPPESSRRLFERGLPDTPGIVGDRAFICERSIDPRTAHATHRTWTLDRLIAQITERQGISLEELYSKLRRRELVVARAQITWFAILWQVASVKDIAHRLQHSPSALSRAIARHKKSSPELFTPELIAHLDSTHWVQMHPQAGTNPARSGSAGNRVRGRSGEKREDCADIR